MAEYHVTWDIDLDAEDEVDAARKARAHQLRPETTATVFTVEPAGRSSGRPRTVDLFEGTIDGEEF